MTAEGKYFAETRGDAHERRVHPCDALSTRAVRLDGYCYRAHADAYEARLRLRAGMDVYSFGTVLDCGLAHSPTSVRL